MALITRLSRLFQADFHAVLDRIEEPDIQLKQAIREMQFELQQDEQRLALLQHESEQLSNLIAENKQKIVTFDDELDICFSVKKEDLARDLITRKLATEQQLQMAIKEKENLLASIQKLEQRIKENGDQLTNMKQKLELLIDSESSPEFQTASVKSGSNIRSEEIEIAFLREKQKRAKS